MFKELARISNKKDTYLSVRKNVKMDLVEHSDKNFGYESIFCEQGLDESVGAGPVY